MKQRHKKYEEPLPLALYLVWFVLEVVGVPYDVVFPFGLRNHVEVVYSREVRPVVHLGPTGLHAALWKQSGSFIQCEYFSAVTCAV